MIIIISPLLWVFVLITVVREDTLWLIVLYEVIIGRRHLQYILWFKAGCKSHWT